MAGDGAAKAAARSLAIIYSDKPEPAGIDGAGRQFSGRNRQQKMISADIRKPDGKKSNSTKRAVLLLV